MRNFVLLLFALTACVSRRTVLKEYRQSPVLTKVEIPNTLIFFMMDGMSVALTQKLLREQSIPNIQNFFLQERKTFQLARATFPSLTHVNLSSILTSQNVDKSPIIGNQIRYKNRILNFELPIDRKILSELTSPVDIFHELAIHQQTSISFSPYYGQTATAQYPLDIKMGLAFQSGDFKYVDKEILESLQFTLKQTHRRNWPRFIFVHLVGLDGYAHHFGDKSKEVLEHAKFLDQKLGEVFKTFQMENSKERQLSVMMTSDHGMTPIKQIVDIRPALRELEPKATIIDQGRLLTLSFDIETSLSKKIELAKKVAKWRGVESTVLKFSNKTLILNSFDSKKDLIHWEAASCEGDASWKIKLNQSPFLCPSQMDKYSEKTFYPYFISNLVSYFKSQESPDLLILAASNTSFGQDTYPAHHGGLTPEETLVPLFLWNLSPEDQASVIPTWKLLKSIRK